MNKYRVEYHGGVAPWKVFHADIGWWPYFDQYSDGRKAQALANDWNENGAPDWVQQTVREHLGEE